MEIIDKRVEQARINGLLGGRPKGAVSDTGKYRVAVTNYIAEQIHINMAPLVKGMMLQAKKGNVMAFTALMDRAFGKAIQGVELSGVDGNPIVFMPPELITKYTFETPQEPANVNDDVIKISKPVLDGSTKP